MKDLNVLKSVLVFCICLIVFTSCTKMDHFYKDYIIERDYVGKPDSSWVKPGEKRVQIGILTPRDPRAKDLVIKWGDSDSAVYPINYAVNSQLFVVENLLEQDYVFSLYTKDQTGLRSLPTELSCPVYGDNFRLTMKERELSHAVIFPDSVALLWKSLAVDYLFGTEVQYVDKTGGIKKFMVTPSTSISILKDMDPTKAISLKTAYMPHEKSFEYMYTSAVNVNPISAQRRSFTLVSSTYTDAEYIDFKYARYFLESGVPSPYGRDIDLCYTLGAGSRSNLITIDGTGFGAFAAAWQNNINVWSVRNVARMKVLKGADAVAMYEGLDEMNRDQMAAAYTNAVGAESIRVYPLALNDIILLNSSDRKLYVAMKVTGIPPSTSGVYGTLSFDFKVSRL